MQEYIRLPEHELQYIEKGCTPYTRPPYATVADNFVVSGDAACLTKAMNGEGVTSSMVHLRLTALALDRALRLGDTSRGALWEIDKKYNAGQGAEFAMMRAILTGVVNAATLEEFYFAFASGMVSDALIGGLNGGKLPLGEIAKSAAAFAGGILTGKVSKNTLKAVVSPTKVKTKLTWKSSNKLVTVKNGKITVNKKAKVGTKVKIVVKTANGKSNYIYIVVK